MWNGQDSLYGNEWIRYDQSYYKLKVAEDGIYRLPYEQMQSAGIPLNDIQAQQFQLFHLGQEVPIYLSSEGNLQDGDFIEFYGEKNRSELDRHLFTNPDEDLLNPEYSLFTDSSAYFLTWVTDGTATLRYNNIENELTDLPAPEPWYWAEEQVVYHQSHFKKYQKFGVTEIYRSRYEGDGFAKNYSNNIQETIKTTSVNSSAPDAELFLSMISNAPAEGHLLNIKINGESVFRDTFYGTFVEKQTLQIRASEISTSTDVQIIGEAQNDRYALATINLKYPRLFDFSKNGIYKIDLPASPNNRYLELSGLSDGSTLILEPATNIRVTPTLKDGVHGVLLPPAIGTRQLVLLNRVQAKPIDHLQAVNFISFPSQDLNYLILSNKNLFEDSLGNNWVQAYADYRASANGGGYKSIVVSVDQLFDQFGYGVELHPLAIRNAFFYLKRFKWPMLANIFIIGKGQEYNSTRTPNDLRTAQDAGLIQVPSFGYPASDNLLFSYNENHVSEIPIGRLAATSPQDVSLYLNKVKLMEESLRSDQTIKNKSWMKQIIHLGGGSDPGEQSSIRRYLENMAEEIEGNGFGGNVQSFYKTSTDPIQTSLSGQIFDDINSGTGLITFFGHSSPGTFDFNIDNPDNYENYGRYPFMISLGCYSGNIFTSNRSISERFTFYEGKGAVAFGASRGVGFLNQLGVFATSFYQNLGNEYYGAGIGKIFHETFKQYKDYSSLGMVTLLEQFSLHGDPALKIYPAPGPDFTIDPESVKFSPDLITAQQDSLSLTFNIINLGKLSKDSFSIAIRQELPSSATVDLVKDTVTSGSFSQKFSYRLPIFGKDMVGQNKYFISIDVDNNIPELPTPAGEANNQSLQIPLYVVDNTARPAYPPPFALINEQSEPVLLKASTTDAFAPTRNYVIEIDTSILFNSPLTRKTNIQQKGGVIEWQPTINFQDSTVYYWRISPDSTNAQIGFSWETSSFAFLKTGKNGWGQGHYWQWLDNSYVNMEWAEENRTLKYLDDFKDVRITQGVYPELRPEIAINNTPYFYIPWDNPTRGGVMISVLDSVTVEPWINQVGTGLDDAQYGSDLPYWLKDYAIFPFRSRSLEQRRTIITFLDSIVPPNNYVVFITTQDQTSDYQPETWAADSLENNNRNLFNLLEEQGARLIRSTANGGAIPYYFVYKKDDPSFKPYEGFGSKSGTTIRNVDIPGVWDNGSLKSIPIGPAREWYDLNWKLRSYNSETDIISFDIYGLHRDSSEVLLMEDLTDPSTDLSEIDATTYPYLRLQFNSTDTTFRSSPQLDYWHLTYKGLPDLALNSSAHLEFNADTLQQGDPLSIEIAVDNISFYGMDSVSVRFTVVDQANNRVSKEQKISPIPAGNSTIIKQEFPSDDFSGAFSLQIEANPDDLPTELYRFNNLGFKDFQVTQDKEGPLLDVTFDGIHILNGDLISSKPLIKIDLTDENTHLGLMDTSLFQLSLRYPGETNLNRIPLNSQIVHFYPADPSNLNKENKASLELSPEFERDGIYELWIETKDATGNSSGSHAYQIEFEVITQSMISNILNYPNPFSTATQFVYTLTGDRPPDNYKLQIMTVSGRVVKEIFPAELGPLRVGTHRTEYTWNGTDDFGDRLANGVYLYRFIMENDDGKSFEHYSSEIDRFFEKGFGKLVILR